MNNIFLSITIFLTSIVILDIFIYSVKKRTIKGSQQYALIIIAIFFHMVGYGFELLSFSKETMMMWIKIQYLGISFIPFLLINFCKTFSEDNSLISRVLLYFSLGINILTYLLIFNYNSNNFFYKNIDVISHNNFYFLSITPGFWYYIQVLTLYTAFVYCTATLIKIIKRNKSLNKSQYQLLLFGFLTPVFVSSLYFLEVLPENIDFTVFSYIPMSILSFFGLFKKEVLNIVPISYESIFQNISESIIITDKNNDIINFNQNALTTFPSLNNTSLISNIDKLFNENNIHINENNNEYIFKINNQVFSLKIENVNNLRNFTLGKLYMFSNITEAYKVHKNLKILSETDELTGLKNRRSFINIYEEKLRNSKNNLYVAMIDIDNFKKINDNLGHSAGDYILEKFALLMNNYFKDLGVTARYGGEEFIVLMEIEKLDTVSLLLDEFRRLIAFSLFNDDTSITISIGFSKCIYNECEKNINAADMALLNAKSNGKNCIINYKNIHEHYFSVI